MSLVLLAMKKQNIGKFMCSEDHTVLGFWVRGPTQQGISWSKERILSVLPLVLLQIRDLKPGCACEPLLSDSSSRCPSWRGGFIIPHARAPLACLRWSFESIFLHVIIRQAMPFCISAKWRVFYEWLWSLSGDVGSWGQFCHSSVSNIFQFNSPTKNQVRNWGHVYRTWLETHWDPGEEAAGNRKWRQNQGNMNYVAGPCSESQGTSIKTRHLLVKDRG